ncbi:decaprenyl-phosphate phosphoribosyltransferase [Geitlerinema splendidum]|nr:decaprenyl-phosphate phosphoribosyltransferase [Geitlerinema splendidum]
MRHLLSALRVRQWTKNLLVFAAPLFAFEFTGESVGGSSLAFILFCGISSGFYLLNDIVDVEADRLHPVKCKRPIASGLVSIPLARSMAGILLLGTLLVAWVDGFSLGATLTGYAVLQLAYNFWLKQVAIWDIMAIALGFVLRAYAGGAATGIPISAWLLLCTAMLALFLGVEKRKAELRLMSQRRGKTRAVLQQYSIPLLTRIESTVTTGAIMTYALWSSGPQVDGAATPWMMLTLPWVLYGIFRYQLLSDPRISLGGNSERPEEILLNDIPILGTVIGWVVSSGVILWLHENRWI